jgi:hypothetical protein
VDDLAARIRHAPGGTLLAAPTQQRLERALGADLTAVRVHTDGEADHLARAVDAVAFTTGPEIFFRSGAYQPSSSDGMRTLTHEVTHTLQQAAGPVAGTLIADGVAVSNPDDQFEQAATNTAAQIVAGNGGRQRPEATESPAVPAGGAASAVQRATAPDVGEKGEATSDDEDEEEEEETEVRAGRRIAADEVVQRLPAGSATPRQPPPREAAYQSLGLVVQRTDHKQPDPNSAYSDAATVESAVYAVETQNDLIVYIGKTIQEDPNDRFKQHLQHPKKQHWKANNYKLDVWGEGDWTPWELATWEQWGIIAAGGRDSGLIENSINGITMDNYWHYKHLHSGRRKYKNLDKFTW